MPVLMQGPTERSLFVLQNVPWKVLLFLVISVHGHMDSLDR